MSLCLVIIALFLTIPFFVSLYLILTLFFTILSVKVNILRYNLAITKKSELWDRPKSQLHLKISEFWGKSTFFQTFFERETREKETLWSVRWKVTSTVLKINNLLTVCEWSCFICCNWSLSLDLCAVTVAVMRPIPWCTAAAHSITYTHMVCSEDYRWVTAKHRDKLIHTPIQRCTHRLHSQNDIIIKCTELLFIAHTHTHTQL